jgi:class 3 adenylate cyclase/YHS domain-containing protein
MLRVFSDSLGKVADACSRLFHLYVHEQLRSGGVGGAELLEATNAISVPLLGLIEPAVLFFNRKAWESAFREDMMLHLAEEANPSPSEPGQFRRAVLFVDLSSFTPLTEAMGDTAAARVIDRFSQIVRAASAQCSGQVVKQIGDEFMVVFPDGRLAVQCGVAIKELSAAERHFPALRIGAHCGSVLYREGDYVGANVNLAARVTAAAKRHQFLVTGAVATEAAGLDIELTPFGTHSLKGLSEPVDLFQVRAPRDVVAKTTDLVCGMELEDGSSEADLNWHGQRLQFCSEDCLRLFLDNPDRYAPSR